MYKYFTLAIQNEEGIVYKVSITEFIDDIDRRKIELEIGHIYRTIETKRRVQIQEFYKSEEKKNLRARVKFLDTRKTGSVDVKEVEIID
jgi:hypothetical protein